VRYASPDVSTVREAGSVIPTNLLLDRISAALDADLIVQLAPHAA
jgi:hypothetical protein